MRPAPNSRSCQSPLHWQWKGPVFNEGGFMSCKPKGRKRGKESPSLSRTQAGGDFPACSIASFCCVRQPCAGQVQSAQICGRDARLGNDIPLI